MGRPAAVPARAAATGRAAAAPRRGGRYTTAVPELPDIEAYVEAISERVVGEPLLGVRLASPFLLRTAAPPLDEVRGKRVLAVSRLGKRIALALEGDLHLVLHLMIAGRLHFDAREEAGAARRPKGRRGQALAAFE